MDFPRDPQTFLKKIDERLTVDEACVVCQYTFQKINKVFDQGAECPDYLDLFRSKSFQREWIPDEMILQKLKQAFQQDLQKDRDFVRNGQYPKDPKKRKYFITRQYNAADLIDEEDDTRFPKKYQVINQQPLNGQEDGTPDCKDCAHNLRKYPLVTTTGQIVSTNVGDVERNLNRIGIGGAISELKDYASDSIKHMVKIRDNIPSTSFIQIMNQKFKKNKFNKHSLRHKKHAKKKFYFKNKWNPSGRNMNNANILTMQTVHTTIGKLSSDTDPCEVPNPPEWCLPKNNNDIGDDAPCYGDNCDKQGKYKTYIDVRHPKIVKVIDRNKGTVSQTTDMGGVEKTVFLQPNNISTTWDVDHKLDRQFKNSDQLNHNRINPNIQAYERPYGSLEVAILPYKEPGSPWGYSQKTEMHNNSHIDYTYDTSIRQSQSAKRVQTNKDEGVKVNSKDYQYGDTYNFLQLKESSKNKFDMKEEMELENKFKFRRSSKIDLLDKTADKELIQKTENELFDSNSDKVELTDTEKMFINAHLIKLVDQINLSKRQTRFPARQWRCVQSAVKEMIEYLCSKEISKSFQKYCQPLKKQMNVIIESFLYYDHEKKICEDIYMCKKEKMI